MRPAREKIRILSSLVTIALVTAAKTACQEQPSQAGENTEPQRRILISIPDRKLALIEKGQVVKIYATAVGAQASPTPTGTYKLAQRIPNPTWYGPNGVVPPGKDNPLGTRWMGLSARGYGIHGTNAPGSIGKAASHGCIRMRKPDLEELFEMVAVGIAVELHGERPELLTKILTPAVAD